jgi:hypothetical protein
MLGPQSKVSFVDEYKRIRGKLEMQLLFPVLGVTMESIKLALLKKTIEWGP